MPEKKTKTKVPRLSDDQLFERLGSFMRAGSPRAKKCPPAEEVIEEALGSLPASRAAKIRDHLSGCQSCFDQSLAVALAAAASKEPEPKEVPFSIRRAIENQVTSRPTSWWVSLWEKGAEAFDRGVAVAFDQLFPEQVMALLAHASGSCQVGEAKSGKQLRVRVPVRKEMVRDANGKVTLPCEPSTKDATLARINGFVVGEGRYAMAALAARPRGWDLALEPAIFRKAKHFDPGDARHLLVMVGTRIRDVEEAATDMQAAIARENKKLMGIKPRHGVVYIVYTIKGGHPSAGSVSAGSESRNMRG